MRRINLLPPEERRRGVALPRRNVLGLLLISGATIVVIMIGVYVLYLVKLHGEESRISQLDQQISQQNQQLASLAPYKNLQSRLQAKKTIADGIYRSRFPWDQFFQGLAFVIPNSTALNSLTAKASPINVSASSGQELSPPGQITFTGVALDSYVNVADFVVRMDNLSFLSDSHLNSATLDQTTYVRPVINFEVVSNLVTKDGQNGNELPLEGTPSGASQQVPTGSQANGASGLQIRR